MANDQEQHAHGPAGNPWPCKSCGKGQVWFTTDETFDGAYDRYHYHCRACGKRWSVVSEVD
jgi:DNA-directed RNA polymerase subunit M/transcription elongation factor TFIIS